LLSSLAPSLSLLSSVSPSLNLLSSVAPSLNSSSSVWSYTNFNSLSSVSPSINSSSSVSPSLNSSSSVSPSHSLTPPQSSTDLMSGFTKDSLQIAVDERSTETVVIKTIGPLYSLKMDKMTDNIPKENWTLYCIYWQPGEDGHLVNRKGIRTERSPRLLTYVGITNNPTRRLRQHNGEIKGGAKYTTRSRGGEWNFLYTVSGFPNRSFVQQWEYRLHTRKKRLNRVCVVCNRFARLKEARETERVTERAPLNSTLKLVYSFQEGHPPSEIPIKVCVCFMKHQTSL